MTRQRLAYLDVLKAMAFIAVVLHHSGCVFLPQIITLFLLIAGI